MYDPPDSEDSEGEAIASLPPLQEDGRAPGSHLPAVLSDYQLIKVAGRGGMGEVWQARHVDTRKLFAVKVLRPDLVTDEASSARFVQEARVMEALVHPNILRVSHVGEQEGHLFFVMEWLDGGTVADQLEERGTFTLQEARDVLWQMIDGLSHAYDRGLVHRDVKPGNVLVSSKRDIKISDFGIAKFLGADERRTGSGVRLGSPWYMSPEQIRGSDVDHRSDIYSLGITLYHLLTGSVPFDGELISVLYRHVHAPLPVSFELEHFGNGAVLPILRKMTAKDPEDRYQSYDDLQFAITRLGDVVAGSGRLSPPAYPTPPQTQTRADGSPVPLAERMDTFHEVPTLPIDEKGGISLSGLETIRLGRNASTLDVAALDSIRRGARSDAGPSPLLAHALSKAREDGTDLADDLVHGGNTSLIAALAVFGIVGLLVLGAVLFQHFKGGGQKPAAPIAATGNPATAPEASKAAVASLAAKPTTRPAMKPLQLADQPPSNATVHTSRVAIQALKARLVGTGPAEVERILGAPEFTDENPKASGMFYSASQWAPQIYDRTTSQPVQRVKVLFFNGLCTDVQGA